WARFAPANPQVVPTHPPPVPVRDRAAERVRLGWGEEYVVLSLGRDEPRKGQSDIRAAVADLPGVRLVTAAGHADPHALYAAADIYVCSSRAEAFCMATQEAAAHGLPVVSTPAGLLSGAPGDVYQPGDVAALRAMIGRHRDQPRRGERQPRPGYHRTLAWYEDLFRSAAGRLPRPASSVRVVYHVAGMGPHWRLVVAEQLDQLRAAGLTRVLCTHVGEGRADLIRLARERAIELVVCNSTPDVKQFERPGIRLVRDLAQAGDEPILYLHSKGVTRNLTSEAYYHDWRRLMMRETVAGWRRCLSLIEDGRDAVGVNWWYKPNDRGEPQEHFSGNIWMASAAWLRRLPDPDRHFRDRWSCERWVGAVPGAAVESLVCSDRKFWAEDRPLLGELLRG
ncbi:glycosyltransferase, partial [bacterium]|nr:glycosyltransferase [bacterium]